MNQNESQSTTKRKRTGGRYARITPELLARVATRRAQGISVRRALSLENPPIPLSHFRQSLDKSVYLSGVWTQKETAAILPIIEEMKKAKAGEWQRLAWILERAFADEYSTRAGNVTVNTTVQTCVGIDDSVLRRAASFVARGESRQQITDVATSGNLDGNREPK